MSSCSTFNLILQCHRYYTRNITRWHLTLRVHLSTEQQRRPEIFFFFSFCPWFCVLILRCFDADPFLCRGSQVLRSSSGFCSYLVMTSRGGLAASTTACRCYCRRPEPQGIHSGHTSNLTCLLAEFYCRLLSVYWHICLASINGAFWVKATAFMLSFKLRFSSGSSVITVVWF